MIVCRLCGKPAKRRFYAADTNYAEMIRLAEAYGIGHAASDEHKAALEAYHGDDLPESPEAALVARIFGKSYTERDRRMDAARRAYWRELRRSTR